jgi:hypothetical protein
LGGVSFSTTATVSFLEDFRWAETDSTEKFKRIPIRKRERKEEGRMEFFLKMQ